MHADLLGRVVVALLLVVLRYSCSSAAAGVPKGAVCELEIMADRRGEEIAHAALTCKGSATPTIAVDEGFLGPFKRHFKGVKWDPDDCQEHGCLLTICGETHATFSKAIFMGVNRKFDNGALCFAGRSKVTLVGAKILSNKGSGGIGVWGQSTLNILSGSLVARNVAVDATGGGICAWENSTVVIRDSIIAENVAVAHSGGGLSAEEGARVVIINSLIEGNLADSNIAGGLLAMDDATVLITNGSVVRNNTVLNGNGGGLAIADYAHVEVSNSTFDANNASAGTGGGAFVDYNASLVLKEGSVFKHNIASFTLGGGALTFFGNSTGVIRGSSLRSNQAWVSNGGAVFARANSSVLITDNSTIMDNRADLHGGGLYVMQNAVINITGGTRFVNNSCNYTGQDIKAEADWSLALGSTNVNVTSPSVSWTRTTCIIGEVKGPKGVCQTCGLNTYSFNASAAACDPCPNHADCTGGVSIVPHTGYWHSDPFSNQIHVCPVTSSCRYGGVCDTGYTGNACGACSEGYGTTTPLNCDRCPSAYKARVFFLGSWVVTVVLVSALLHTTLSDNIKGGGGVLRPSHFLKVLVRHLQYLVILHSILPQWPASLSALFTAAGWAFSTTSDSGSVSLDCLFRFRGVPLGVNRVLFLVIAPVVVLCSALFIRVVLKLGLYGVFRLLPRRRFQGTPLKVDVVVGSFVVIFFFYPSWVRAALSMFACYGLDEAGHEPYPQYALATARGGYWVSNIQQPCWEGWHLKWTLLLGLPSVLLFCVAVPFATWVFLHMKSGNLQEPSFKQYASFLYHDYKPAAYNWEVVNMLQIALTVSIPVFRFTLGAYFSCVLLNLALALFLALQYMYKPLAMDQLQHTSMGSLACLYFTTSMALTLFTVDREVPLQYSTAMGVLGLVANVGFVGWCLMQAGTHSAGTLKQVWRACAGVCMRMSAWVGQRTGLSEQAGKNRKSKQAPPAV
jgi:hypothetical protein